MTAWDSFPRNIQRNKPSDYLQENLPLLHQFIGTNSSAYDFASFGVSITGGDLEMDEDFRKEYQGGDPYKAGYVIHEFGGKRQESIDHTLPVAWAMGLNVASPDAVRGGS